MTENKIYDTAILGGGPAGYTAALYCARAGIRSIVLEKFSAGGQMTQTDQIDNYPGFDDGVDGFTLGEKMKKGAEKFGAKTKQAEILSVDLLKTPKIIKTDSGDIIAKTVIIAMGAEHRHLGIKNEEALIGKGVGYCAACDGMLFKGKTAAIVGGGNSAASDALLLSRICKKVYLIHRRDTLRATKIYHQPLQKAENVEFKWNSEVKELVFDNKLTGIKIKNVKTDKIEEIETDALFISIGREPNTTIFKGQLSIDASGYIEADETTKTNIPGVFAAGDIRTKYFRQIVTAASDGATAAHFVEEYLEKN